MLDWLLPQLTPLTIGIIVVYIVIHVATFYWAMSANRKFLKAPPEVNAKYSAFARTDAHLWSWSTMFPCKQHLLA